MSAPDITGVMRRPKTTDLIYGWKTAASGVNLADESTISEVPDVPGYKQIKESASYDVDRRTIFLEIGLASAFRAFAKSLASKETLDLCLKNGATTAALLLSYSAAYYAARSFVILCGFIPYHPNLNATLDVFFSSSDFTNESRFYHHEQWSHEVLWKMAIRLVRTIDRPVEIETALKSLRTDKLEKVSTLRNKQSYWDSILYAGDVPAEADYPEFLKFQASTPSVRYKEIFDAFAQIVTYLMNEIGAVATSNSAFTSHRLALI